MPDVPGYRFDGWALHPRERVLRIDGAPVPIGGRAFDVLTALVEKQGELVTKTELLDAAWPGLVVEENNVSVQIAALRKLLGQAAIATVPGLGYRLCALPTPTAPRAAGEAGETTARAAGPGSDPTTSSLFGRVTAMADVLALLGRHRLVSIVGTGGVGKTSLARAVVAQLAPTLPVHWIDAAPVRDDAQLVRLVAKMFAVDLGASSNLGADLMSALGGMRALVVIDNCEQLAVEVAVLTRQARDLASGIAWLVTSQVPLHAGDEVVYRLDPLAIPDAEAPLAEALRHGAIELLDSRGRAADRRFRISSDNLEAAIDLCRQLDGLPLAIEMAAARVASLGLEGVRSQLRHRLRLLAAPRDAPSRHHTLVDMFDWGHGLLSHSERIVFRRLEPFASGCTAEMATGLACGLGSALERVDEAEALDALGALVDKSMVQRSPGQPDRFFLFMSARDYAARQLLASAEVDAVHRQHAVVVAAWFADAEADQARLGDDDWAARYVPERDNVRAALDWACRNALADPDLLARLVAALARIDAFTQWQPEIVKVEVPLDALARARPLLRASAHLELGGAHYSAGNREEGSRLTRLALQDFRAADDLIGTYRSLSQLMHLYDARPGMHAEAADARHELSLLDDRAIPLRTRMRCSLANSLFDGSRTVALLTDLKTVAQRAGFAGLAALCDVHLTDQLLVEGRFDEVVATAQRFLDAGETRPRVRGLMLHNQALARVRLGRIAEASVGARAALRMLPSYAHVIVGTLALAAALDGRMADAALMSGYAERVRSVRHQTADLAESTAIDQTSALLRDALPAQALADLLRAGAGMSTAAIMELALAG